MVGASLDQPPAETLHAHGGGGQAGGFPSDEAATDGGLEGDDGAQVACGFGGRGSSSLHQKNIVVYDVGGLWDFAGCIQLPQMPVPEETMKWWGESSRRNVDF